MNYKDALEAALRAVRSGQDLESAIAPYPEHVARLRDDIALATRLRTAGSESSPAAEAAIGAWSRLSSELAGQRTVPESPRRFWHGLSQGMLLRGAVAAVVVIAIAAAIGLSTDSAPFDSSTAEAATVEGVVVENSNGLLTLQTADGLSRVRVDSNVSVTDEAGQTLSLANLEAGQLIFAKGQRLAQGEIAARTIARRPAPALDVWCGVNQGQCEILVQRIQQSVERCELTNSPMCASIRGRLQAIRGRLADLARLEELRLACEGGTIRACTELAVLCRQHPDLCRGIEDLLRRRLGSNSALPESTQTQLRQPSAPPASVPTERPISLAVTATPPARLTTPPAARPTEPPTATRVVEQSPRRLQSPVATPTPQTSSLR